MRYIVMLNPSDADRECDDDTICKCMHRAYRDGFGGLAVVNLFAWRDKNATNLKRAHDPVGPENDTALETALAQAAAAASRDGTVIAAWSALGCYQRRNVFVQSLCDGLGVKLWCFGKSTKTGLPFHPARVRRDAVLVRFC